MEWVALSEEEERIEEMKDDRVRYLYRWKTSGPEQVGTRLTKQRDALRRI
jgi:hypothetical protein